MIHWMFYPSFALPAVLVQYFPSELRLCTTLPLGQLRKVAGQDPFALNMATRPTNLDCQAHGDRLYALLFVLLSIYL